MATPDDRVKILLAKADALCEVRRFADAEQLAREAAVLSPSDHLVFEVWSRTLLLEDRYDEAAKMAAEAIRLEPNSYRGQLLRSQALTRSLARAQGFTMPGRGRAAVHAAREAIRLAPWNPNGHLALARAFSITFHHKKAADALDEAKRLAPNDAVVWTTESEIALRAGSPRTALIASQRALKINPNNTAALHNLGVALRATGNVKEGTETIARAARIEPGLSERVATIRRLSRPQNAILAIAAVVLSVSVALMVPANNQVPVVAAGVVAMVWLGRNGHRLTRWRRRS